MSIKSIGTGDGSRVCRIGQGDWIAPPDGDLPTTPTWDTLRFEEFSLDVDTTVEDSKEVNPDREYRGTYPTRFDVKGGIKVPLIYQESDNLILDALHCSQFTTNVASIGSAFRFALYEETQELNWQDLYKRFVNTMVNRATFTFPSEGTAMLDLDLMGTHMLDDTAIITGATYPEQSYTRTPGTAEAISGVTWTGLPSGVDPIIESVTITIDHGLRRRPRWDSLYSTFFGRNRAKVDVSIKAYLDDLKLYRTVYDRATAALQFDYGLANDNKYRINMPRIEWVQPRTDPRRSGTDTTITLEGRANKTSTSSSFKITRLPAS